MVRFLLVMLCFAAVPLTACNTIEGVGEDIEASGEFISDTADDARRKIH